VIVVEAPAVVFSQKEWDELSVAFSHTLEARQLTPKMIRDLVLAIARGKVIVTHAPTE
jgi:hypothetical protein